MAPGGDFIQSIYLSGWSFNYVDLLLLPVGLHQTTGCGKARTTELLVYDSELDPLLIEFVDVMMTNGDDGEWEIYIMEKAAEELDTTD